MGGQIGNSITTVSKDFMVIEFRGQALTKNSKDFLVIQKVGDRDKQGNYSIHDYSNCLPANPMSDRGQVLMEKSMDQPNIRIRKLTPKECLRLMAFDDKDYEAIKNAGISNSQTYKQAGNSICTNVLEAIFGQLFEGKEEHYKRWDTVELPNISRVMNVNEETSAK